MYAALHLYKLSSFSTIHKKLSRFGNVVFYSLISFLTFLFNLTLLNITISTILLTIDQ